MSDLSLEIKPLRDKAAEAFKDREYLKALNLDEEALHQVCLRESVIEGFRDKTEETKGLPSPEELA